jgi:hypothetical protein
MPRLNRVCAWRASFSSDRAYCESASSVRPEYYNAVPRLVLTLTFRGSIAIAC